MLNQKSYYYLCSYPLGVNSIVEPGNWGRILKTYLLGGNLFIPCRELAFEQVRLNHYPSKPSRLESIYVCENLADIQKFKLEGRSFDLTYEVEILNPTTPYHRGDWTQQNFTNSENVESLFSKAHAYWTAQNVTSPEILIQSEIKILKKI